MMAVGLQHGISRRSFFATPVVLAASRVLSAADRKPNVVLILIDDFGYDSESADALLNEVTSS